MAATVPVCIPRLEVSRTLVLNHVVHPPEGLLNRIVQSQLFILQALPTSSLECDTFFSAELQICFDKNAAKEYSNMFRE
jgi:hypothetical protein